MSALIVGLRATLVGARQGLEGASRSFTHELFICDLLTARANFD
jgi:hypothetical protein